VLLGKIKKMEDFKKNRAVKDSEQEPDVKSASEQRSELSHQERSAQQENNGGPDASYNYDEYDSYSPWG
jgi:hypothetical protein